MLKDLKLAMGAAEGAEAVTDFGKAAEAAYQTVMTGIKSGQPITLELTCEKQEEKKIAVMVSEVAAVQIYEKSGSASSSGKAPGFFAMAAE